MSLAWVTRVASSGRTGPKSVSPWRVTAGGLVCLASAGCVTAPERRETVAMPDCRPAVASPAQPGHPRPTEPGEGRPAVLWSDGRRFQVLDPALDKSRIDGAASSDTSPPLGNDDPRLQAYFEQIKRRIEAVWAYPQEAYQRGQSGSGAVEVAIRRDGQIGWVTIVQSTNSTLLDRSFVTAIRLAAPFGPIPCRIGEETLPMSINFRYVL